MNFRKWYTLNQLKRFVPSFWAQNRLFMERESRKRGIWGDLGAVIRHGRWSTYVKTNIHFLNDWFPSRSTIVLGLGFILGLLYISFDFGSDNLPALLFVSYPFWTGVDGSDYASLFLVWVSWVILESIKRFILVMVFPSIGLGELGGENDEVLSGRVGDNRTRSVSHWKRLYRSVSYGTVAHAMGQTRGGWEGTVDGVIAAAEKSRSVFESVFRFGSTFSLFRDVVKGSGAVSNILQIAMFQTWRERRQLGTVTWGFQWTEPFSSVFGASASWLREGRGDMYWATNVANANRLDRWLHIYYRTHRQLLKTMGEITQLKGGLSYSVPLFNSMTANIWNSARRVDGVSITPDSVMGTNSDVRTWNLETSIGFVNRRTTDLTALGINLRRIAWVGTHLNQFPTPLTQFGGGGLELLTPLLRGQIWFPRQFATIRAFLLRTGPIRGPLVGGGAIAYEVSNGGGEGDWLWLIDLYVEFFPIRTFFYQIPDMLDLELDDVFEL